MSTLPRTLRADGCLADLTNDLAKGVTELFYKPGKGAIRTVTAFPKGPSLSAASATASRR